MADLSVIQHDPAWWTTIPRWLWLVWSLGGAAWLRWPVHQYRAWRVVMLVPFLWLVWQVLRFDYVTAAALDPYVFDLYPAVFSFIAAWVTWIETGCCAYVAWLIDRNATGYFVTRIRAWATAKHAQRLAEDDAANATMIPFRPLPNHDPDACFIFGEALNWDEGTPTRKYLYLPPNARWTNWFVLGSTGSAKTAGLIYRLMTQVIDYAAQDEALKWGGMVMDVKGDMSAKVQEFLDAAGRGDDHFVIEAEGGYIANPLSDPCAGTQTMAASVGNLIQQLNPTKEGFFKGAYGVVLTNCFRGLRTVIDYVDMVTVDHIAGSDEAMQAFMVYADRVMGRGDRVLVYANTITNTPTPWVYLNEDELEYVPFDTEDEELLRRRCGEAEPDAVVEARNQRLEAATIACQTIDPNWSEQDLSRWALYRHLDGATINEPQQQANGKRVSVPVSVWPADWPVPNPPPPRHQREWDTYHEAFVDACLTRHAMSKIDWLNQVLGYFLPGTMDQLVLTNPFPKSVNPFGHDDLPHYLKEIVFAVYPRLPLVRWLVDKGRIHAVCVDGDVLERYRAFQAWYTNNWVTKGIEFRGKIYAGIENIVTYFKEPAVRRTFAPSMMTHHDHLLNPTWNRRAVFPGFDYFMSNGMWVSYNVPEAEFGSPTSRVLGTMFKQLFQSTSLQRTSTKKRARLPQWNYERPCALFIDECQQVVTTGDSADSDTGWLAQNRQSRVWACYATQSMEQLQLALADKKVAVEAMLGNMRTKFILGVETKSTAEYAADLLGKGYVYQVSETVGENEGDTPFSLAAGDFHGSQAGTSSSLSYQQTVAHLVRPDELLNLGAFYGYAIVYDGSKRSKYRFAAKPYFRPLTESCAAQQAAGIL